MFFVSMALGVSVSEEQEKNKNVVKRKIMVSSA